MANQERKSGTIGECVYTYLKKSIMELKLKPGEDISIKEISEQLNVSRSPVRDAVIKLEKEGLISSVPQKGTAISKINLKRAMEEQFLRTTLEEKVIELFLDSYTKEQLRMMKESIQSQRLCMEEMDYRGMLEYDDQFHQIFFQGADRMLCWETIQNTSGHYRRVRLLTNFDKAISENVIKEHETIYESLRDGNTSNFTDLLKRHLGKLKYEKNDLIKTYPDLFEEEGQVILSSFDHDYFESLKHNRSNEGSGSEA